LGAIDLRASQRLRVVDCPCDAVLKFADALGMTGDAALAGRPIARRQVVQHLDQPVAQQPLGDLLLRIRVRKEILDAGEARFRGRLEAVEKIDFVVQHREVGGELGHDEDFRFPASHDFTPSFPRKRESTYRPSPLSKNGSPLPRG
jgi:hypothetical protein